MNKENLLKWADALESGRYQQTQGSYGCGFEDDKNEFCCLNVAYHTFSGVGYFGRERQKVSDMRHFMKETFGICDYSPFVFMNDDKRFSFNKIAKEIRKLAAGEENAIQGR